MENQLSFLNKIDDEVFDNAMSDFPCWKCKYDARGCCNYPEKDDDYCVLGDKRIPND